MTVTSTAESRLALYDSLMRRAVGDPNDAWIAQITASWLCGQTALPDCLGLAPARLRDLLASHFPGARVGLQRGLMLDPDRREEVGDLAALMRVERAGRSDSELWLAEILAVACMGSDHLWQDLGLWSRKELTALMRANFPALAARNQRDMKWKKFLYKQLCETEGIYVCRAPSCDVCNDFALCFGPEDGPSAR